VQRIRYLKECVTLDVVLGDGRSGYFTLGAGDISIEPPIFYDKQIGIGSAGKSFVASGILDASSILAIRIAVVGRCFFGRSQLS
jgi:hypothetical protein